MFTNETRSNLSYTSLFMMLWCLMIIAEFDNGTSWRNTHYNVLSLLTAYTGLFFARSKYVMAGVCLFQVLACIKNMPVVANHWFFTMILSGMLLTGLLYQIVRDRFNNDPIDPDRVKKVFPVIRLLVIILYFFAVFHKLNAGFFDPRVSCAVHIWEQIANGGFMLPLWTDPPLWFRYVLIYGTLLIEAAIPVLLCFRRTWFAAFIVGCGFHLMTGLIMRHFPTLAWALYFLFIPKGAVKPLTQKFETVIRRLSQDSFGVTGALILQATVFTVGFVLAFLHDHSRGIGHYRWGVSGELSAMWPVLRVWWLLAVTVFVMAVYFIARHGYFRIQRNKLFRTKWPVYYAVVPFFVFNCLTPYMGLKSVDTISMWSNLHTFNGENNHLILRGNGWKIFPYMDDMVEIIDTNVPDWRRKLVHDEKLVAWTMLKQMVQNQVRDNRGRVYIQYMRGGHLHTVEDAAWDPELMEPNPYWFRKCIHIKFVQKGELRDCTW